MLSAAMAIVLLVFGTDAHGQNLTGESRHLLMDMRNVAEVMKAYYKTHKKLPDDPSSCDALLHNLFKKSAEYNPTRPLPMPQSKGAYRKLGRFKIEYNLNINQESNTQILWRTSPPDSWKGKSGTIGIISNGAERFLVYALGEEGVPIRAQNRQTIFFTYNCKEGTSDERLF